MFPSKSVIETLKAMYPIGCRVELIRMVDEFAPPKGTLGTIRGVDDCGSLQVYWDTGSGLNVLFGIDTVRKVC